MSDQFFAEIRLFACTFAPEGWAFCNGQILPLSQNTALFSLLGSMYGGDGKSTFALPDLRGRLAIAAGQGANLSERYIADTGGSESVTLMQSEMPQHSHMVSASTSDGDQTEPTNNLFASQTSDTYAPDPTNTKMADGMVAEAGGNQPHNNLMPYLVVNFCIALQGIYPPRS
jgi:microcystin-dependent protein